MLGILELYTQNYAKGRKLEKIVPANRSDPPGSVSDWSPKPCPAIGRKSSQVPTISISDKKPLAIYFKLWSEQHELF